MNLTDEQIIKALECCDIEQKDCWQCSLQNKWDCHFILRKNTLDLINRQQAEIDKLERTISHLEDVCNGIPDVVRAEAIKEFAERLKEKEYHPIRTPAGFKVVPTNDIDNLVKEMVGDNNV